MLFNNPNNKSSSPIVAFFLALESIPLLLLSALIAYSNSSSEQVFYSSILFCTIILWGLFSIKYGNANIQSQIRRKTEIVQYFGDDSENRWREILGGVVGVFIIVYLGLAFNNDLFLGSLVFTNLTSIICSVSILKYDLIIQKYHGSVLPGHEKPTAKNLQELKKIFFGSGLLRLFALGVILILFIFLIIASILFFEHLDKVK